MNEFFRTGMGHTFFQSTLPNLVKELAKLNENLARIAKAMEPKAP